MNQEQAKQFGEIVHDAIHRQILKKIVFSRPQDKKCVRMEAKLLSLNASHKILQTETHFTDGKVLHCNLELTTAAEELCETAQVYSQINILTTAGDCEYRWSKKGKCFVNNHIDPENVTAAKAMIRSHNRAKKYILTEGTAYPFLIHLGICDANGRVYDKKQAKFRQINKFLEVIEDVYSALPEQSELCIYDLGCGKSYLTFAVYYYLTEIRNRAVHMYGMDLKADVIEQCTAVAKALGYNGLHFLCGNINELDVPSSSDMVISLHACDIATDIVLENSVRWKAKVILSSPCCQHELYGQLRKADEKEELFGDYPILTQKFCALMTDALRCHWLEIKGYDVTVIEFIDPEETPKNILIKAIRQKKQKSVEKIQKQTEEYLQICRKYGIDPYLRKKL